MEDINESFKLELSYYKENDLVSQPDLVEFLRYVQELYGYIPADKIDEIGSIFSVSDKLIDKLIDIYPYLSKQAFEEEIVVCNGVNCSKRGSLDLLDYLENVLNVKRGEVTDNGKYMLRTQKCFKQCAKGPNVKIRNVVHNGVTKELIDKLIDE